MNLYVVACSDGQIAVDRVGRNRVVLAYLSTEAVRREISASNSRLDGGCTCGQKGHRAVLYVPAKAKRP